MAYYPIRVVGHSVPGKDLRGSLPDVIERAGTEAIERYNQEETQGMPVEHEPADFRRLALLLEGAEEGSHMGSAIFGSAARSLPRWLIRIRGTAT